MGVEKKLHSYYHLTEHFDAEGKFKLKKKNNNNLDLKKHGHNWILTNRDGGPSMSSLP